MIEPDDVLKSIINNTYIVINLFYKITKSICITYMVFLIFIFHIEISTKFIILEMYCLDAILIALFTFIINSYNVLYWVFPDHFYLNSDACELLIIGGRGQRQNV